MQLFEDLKLMKKKKEKISLQFKGKNLLLKLKLI
jgi:hypothetical protein